MTPSVPVGEVRPLGDRAYLIGVADAASARALALELVTRLAGAADVLCGSATVMVHASDPATQLSSLQAAMEAVRVDLARRGPSDHRAGPRRLLTVPCRFDGPDLGEVAALAGCRPDEVAALLTTQPLTVAVTGFSPGFAYLEGLPSPLERVPRRPRPRPVVPAGSVAVANGHAAVYPTASPGGWHLVGRTGVRSVHAGTSSLRRARTGRHGPLHRGPRGRVPRTGVGGAAAMVAAIGRANCFRGRRPRPARRGSGRWAPWRRRGRGPRCRSGRSGVVRAG